MEKSWETLILSPYMSHFHLTDTHIWKRGHNLPILWRLPPPILPAFLFSNFVQPPSLSFPVASNLPSSLLFLLPCFFGWIGDRATFDVLLYLKSDAQPFRNIHFISFNKSPLKVVFATFFLVCFVCVNERPCEIRKMLFISFQTLFSFLR